MYIFAVAPEYSSCFCFYQVVPRFSTSYNLTYFVPSLGGGILDPDIVSSIDRRLRFGCLVVLLNRFLELFYCLTIPIFCRCLPFKCEGLEVSRYARAKGFPVENLSWTTTIRSWGVYNF